MDVDIDVLMEPGPSCHVLRCANSGASNEHGTRDAGVCLVSSARSAHFWRAQTCAISSCPEYLSHFPALLWPGAARECVSIRWWCAGNLTNSSIQQGRGSCQISIVISIYIYCITTRQCQYCQCMYCVLSTLVTLTRSQHRRHCQHIARVSGHGPQTTESLYFGR